MSTFAAAWEYATSPTNSKKTAYDGSDMSREGHLTMLETKHCACPPPVGDPEEDLKPDG
ncbi:hypothetical protein JYU34_016688 [Plutella xylostella]|uniref:Uncharacterized protein n=1 Tax=Plutella xylostella TaxID=51655 RepID=A0ABQ7Q383_PLUXY|nr:hypothetical protein JYU34_016688 [Plutella xylostella]